MVVAFLDSGIRRNDGRGCLWMGTKVSTIWLWAEWHIPRLKATVIPAQAGIQTYQWWSLSWIPAFAGMTGDAVSGRPLSKYHLVMGPHYSLV